MKQRHLLAGIALALSPYAVMAGEVYSQVGIPGVMLGYAQPLGAGLSVRGDLGTAGSHRKNTTEDGIDYTGKLKTDRSMLLLDWHPFQGSFRLSLGAMFSKYEYDLAATGAGGTVTLGSTTYTTTPDDHFDVTVKFPKTTPYVGVGWGHQEGAGWRFVGDIGAAFGRATVTATVSGPWAQVVTQSDIDQETAQLRDNVGKVRWIPQLTFGVGYSF